MASLALTPVTSAANANLTTLAYDDYASWAGATNGTPINRKSGGGSIIPVPALVGGAAWSTYTGDPRTLSATDSTPTASWSSDAGIFNGTFGTGTGYEWSSAGGNGFPADTTSRTLRIYFGAYDVVSARVELSLSDASASPITDTTLAGFDNTSSDYYIDVTYAAASGGQTLNVKITVQQQRGSGFSNITLNAALIKVNSTGTNLTPGAGPIAVTGPAPTVTRTANVNLSPAAGAVAITGPAPTVARTANQALTPSAAVLTLMGYAPSVVQASASVSLSPGAAVIAITGYAPTVQQSGGSLYPPGSGGAPLEYFEAPVSAKERKRQKRAAAWAEEERRITAALARKSRPDPLDDEPSARGGIAESILEALRTKAPSPAVEKEPVADSAPQRRAVAKVEAEIARSAAEQAQTIEAEVQIIHAASAAQGISRRKRNEEQAIAHALLMLMDS